MKPLRRPTDKKQRNDCQTNEVSQRLSALSHESWAKTINSMPLFFGVWNNPEAAMIKYLDERDDLQAGRVLKSKGDTQKTVFGVCDHFMDLKRENIEAGQRSPQILHG